MKVFVVMGGYYQEDYKVEHMKVFSSRDSANNYMNTLTTIGFYDEHYDRTTKYDYADVFEEELQE